MIARAVVIAATVALAATPSPAAPTVTEPANPAPANAEPANKPATATPAAATPALAALEREVREHPDDVDLRLRFAIALSHADRRDDARREAREVLARAPDYHDAALVLVRLDAWDHRWPQARAQLDEVLAKKPDHVEARLLAVDIALWSGDTAGARRALAAVPAGAIDKVDLMYRQAQIAQAERQHREALALARKIAEIEPTHAGARALRDSIATLSIESATDAELYPTRYEGRYAVGETLTATVYPRARWSATAAYEYRRRFATDNHRIALRGDWRPTDRWDLLAFVRAGFVEVVPKLTTFGEARYNLGRWVVGGRYTYDRMPWPGDLHRVQLSLGVALPKQIRLDGDIAVGVLRGCDSTIRVWSGRVRASWENRTWALGGAYGYGLEADRAITVSDPCANPNRMLVDHDVHAGGIDVGRMLRQSRLALRLGYGLELRASSTLVHIGTLAVRAWF